MRVSHSWQLAFVLCFFASGRTLTNAEDANNGNGSGGNNQKFTVCSNSVIVVEELQVLCDSPGQYYYGSTYYRNAVKCKAKDKAKVEIAFEIGDNLQSSPYLTLDVEAYGTVETVRVYDSKYLCDISDLSSLDGQVCPQPGRYMLSPVFYWGEQYDGYSYTFRPRIEMGLASKQYSNAYDLGGANTDRCTKGTSEIAGWNSESFQEIVDKTGSTFFITLTVAFILLGLFYVGSRRFIHKWPEFPMKQLGRRQQERATSPQEALDYDGDHYVNEDDIKKMSLMARSRDLIDA